MACMDSIPSHAMQHTNGQLALVVHYRETPKPPIELCPVHVSLVFLHMVFGPAWFCIEPCSMVLHVLLFSQRRRRRMFFVILKLFLVLLPAQAGSKS